jgi:hypothetical protein
MLERKGARGVKENHRCTTESKSGGEGKPETNPNKAKTIEK